MDRSRCSSIGTACGTDAPAIPHGRNAKELVALVARGMTPIQAIRSATVEAARALRQEGRVGTLAVGAWGDLIAVVGDPLKDTAGLKPSAEGLHLQNVARLRSLIRSCRGHLGRDLGSAIREPNHAYSFRPCVCGRRGLNGFLTSTSGCCSLA